MQALVAGPAPRASLFSDLLNRAGHTVVTSPAEAETIFLLQRESCGRRVSRQEAIDDLKEIVPYISRPCQLCLVSIEPNTSWPIGMTHAVRTSLIMAAAHPLRMTRAHLTSLTDPNFEQLILGAKEEAVSALVDAFAPLVPAECTLRVSSIYEAERDADYHPDLA